MFIDRFYGEKQKILDEVSICIGESKPAKNSVLYSTPDFPLVDLLYQLYKAAIDSAGELPENGIITLVEQYRKQVDDSFNYSFEDLVEHGWIETCFGHYKIIGHRKSGIDEIFRNESMKCADQDILRFIFWADEQQDDINSITNTSHM